MTLRAALLVLLLVSFAACALALPLPVEKVPAFCIPKMWMSLFHVSDPAHEARLYRGFIDR